MTRASWVQHVQTERGQSLWILRTRRTAYVLGLDDYNQVQHMYWGAALKNVVDYGEPSVFSAWPYENPAGISNEEYSGWGNVSYTEPCLKLSGDDGDRMSHLEFQNAEVHESENDPTLLIHLLDPHHKLFVSLNYRVFPEQDLIERKVTLTNQGPTPLQLEQAYSACWHLPQRDAYTLTHLAGRWGEEFQIQETELPFGKTVLESRVGITGFNASPFFALGNEAAEARGDVWFGVLAYSGNWQLVIERTAHGQTLVSGGISSFDFAWELSNGETFETPAFISGFTDGGYGQASRHLHAYGRKHVLPSRSSKDERPTLYNSWYVTTFDVNVGNQLAAAGVAAELGLELFVMDDGWFGQRYNDRAGLGDWYVNKDKFPAGLEPLIAQVNDLGMAFGLWVEPEMVNPDSDLYRAHPEWVYHFPERSRSEVRHQLVLNLSRSDVQEYLVSVLDKLLSQNNIHFIKWDMNRPFSEPGWPDAIAGREREIWVRHTNAFYNILATLRQKHPSVLFESCASGGGRIDYGVMRHTEQFWLSDNTNPVSVLHMQEGFSLAYPLKTRMAWVADDPFPLEFRFHVAMSGVLGVGANVMKWTPDEQSQAKRLVALYKEIRGTVQDGDYYRLRSPRKSPLSAVQFVAQDEGEVLVFAFLVGATFGHVECLLQLQGLDPDSNYDLDGKRHSGQALMKRGLDIALRGDNQSCLLRLQRVGG